MRMFTLLSAVVFATLRPAGKDHMESKCMRAFTGDSACQLRIPAFLRRSMRRFLYSATLWTAHSAAAKEWRTISSTARATAPSVQTENGDHAS
jgi:hypothetical protein